MQKKMSSRNFRSLFRILLDSSSQRYIIALNLKLLDELGRSIIDVITFLIQIMFIYIDIADENLAKPYLTLFGLEEAESTVVSFPVNYMHIVYEVSLF